MKVGIVGLPNAGKSSLFNALTKARAEAANYPFTTVEPNVAVVPVPDERLDAVGRRPLAPPKELAHRLRGSVSLSPSRGGRFASTALESLSRLEGAG